MFILDQILHFKFLFIVFVSKSLECRSEWHLLGLRIKIFMVCLCEEFYCIIL